MDTQIEKTANETLATFASKLGVTVEDILSHCRKTELVDARSMIVAILIERPHVRQQDIAPLLGISQAAVSKLLARHRALKGFDSRYRMMWEALQNK
jgi:predicted XRE-type DNA-binding protein